MNKVLGYSVLAMFLGMGGEGAAQAASEPVGDALGVNNLIGDNMVAQGYYGTNAASSLNAREEKRDPGIAAGPLKITFGGFTEFASIYRTRNETSDVGSNFGAIPFANNQNYYVPEYRESGRQSRFAMLVQGPMDGANKAESYMEADFLSSGTSSNSKESNSYTLRIRQFYGLWKNEPNDFYVLAGQSWSLATLFKKGLVPRQENIPLTIDAQYVTGTNWARQAQIRIVKNYGKQLAVGLSLEEPQNVFAGTNPGTTASAAGGSLLNATANYSTDIAPDMILKVAADPGFGHYELYGMSRFFHDRSAPSSSKTPGVNPATNHTTVAGSLGFGAILPVLPKRLDFQVNGLFGRGNGRYGSGQLADSTFNPGDGSISAVQEMQVLVGLIAHPTKDLDAYFYAGMEHAKGEYSLNNVALTTSTSSTGTTSTLTSAADNSACNNNGSGGFGPAAATGFSTSAVPTGNTIVETPSCSGNVGTERMLSGGFWWKFYRGSLGYLMAGPQVSFTQNQTYTASNGSVGRTNDTMVFFSFRYYPFQ